QQQEHQVHQTNLLIHRRLCHRGIERRRTKGLRRRIRGPGGDEEVRGPHRVSGPPGFRVAAKGGRGRVRVPARRSAPHSLRCRRLRGDPQGRSR
ncbi:hypothetical protein LINGRAHAP2_LOCUS13624, partial [Linum grandiflorum]